MGVLPRLWFAVFPLLLLQSGRVLSVSSPRVFLSSVRLLQLSVSLSQRLLHTFPRWLAPLPSPVPSRWLFFPLCSSLQRGEKHTCQIQVGHHTVSHPRQLLSTGRFDANKFFSIVVLYRIAPVSLAETRWQMQQLFSVSVHVTEQLRCLVGPVQTFFTEGRITGNGCWSSVVIIKGRSHRSFPRQDNLVCLTSSEKSIKAAKVSLFLQSLSNSTDKESRVKLLRSSRLHRLTFCLLPSFGLFPLTKLLGCTLR